jgi:hypothetical protein
MRKEDFMRELRNLAEEMKIQYRKTLGYAMYTGVSFVPNKVSELASEISKSNKELMNDLMVSKLRECFKIKSIEFQSVFNCFSESILKFQELYNRRDCLQDNEYLDKRDFRIIEHMTNFELNFVLNHLYIGKEE